jgi:cytochrome c5
VNAVKSFRTWISLGIGIGLMAAAANAVPPGTTEQIRERVQPFGQLCRAGEECGQATAAVATGPLTGEAVYNQFCFACHASGVGGAPVLGDVAGWAPRMEQGMDTLWDHTLNGINAMPAKGTCMNCSDDELRGAMQYMVDAVQPQ